MASQRERGGTKIVFDIAKRGDETEVCFSHAGLWPDDECFRGYSRAWSSLIKRGFLCHRMCTSTRCRCESSGFTTTLLLPRSIAR